jgi:glutamate synthase domain-containing protein 2
VGRPHEFLAICKAMVETKILPDFITVDGGEGGTGAAPLEFTDSVGTPLEEGLSFVHNALIGFGLREKIRVIASGRVFTAMSIVSRLALGADMVNSARGMLLALGCIHALRCNSNHCPVGITTNNPELVRGLVVEDKLVRVANFHRETIHALAEMVSAMGYEHPHQVLAQDVLRRVSPEKVMNLAELFPEIPSGSLLNSSTTSNNPSLNKWNPWLEESQSHSYEPNSVKKSAARAA